MKKYYLVICIISLISYSGCAGIPHRPGALQVSIRPQTVCPGGIVVVEVMAPKGTKAVTGSLDIPGSPMIPLHSQDEGQTWSFKTQIPLGAVWTPGRYRVIVQGQGPDGRLLKGETWVIAP